MDSLLSSPQSPASALLRRRPLTFSSTPNRNGGLSFRAKSNDQIDPLLQDAIFYASLRFRETHRPEPLFVDPCAGCFVDPNAQMDMKQCSHHYCLATKYIDD